MMTVRQLVQWDGPHAGSAVTPAEGEFNAAVLRGRTQGEPMPHQSGARPAALRAAAISACLSTSLLAAPSAFASGTTGAGAGSCRATVAELSLLGSSAIAISDNVQPDCVTSDGGVHADVLGLVDVGLVRTRTESDPGKNAKAAAELADLRIGTNEIADQLAAALITGDSSIVRQVVGGLEGASTSGGLSQALAPLSALGLSLDGIDQGGLTNLLGQSLPDAIENGLPDLATAEVLRATATSTCDGTKAVLDGHVEVVGADVLGHALGAIDEQGEVVSLDSEHLLLSTVITVDQLLDRIIVHARPGTVLSLVIGSERMSLRQLLTTKGGLLGAVNAVLPLGSTLQSILGQVTTQGQAALANADLPLPAGLLKATVTAATESGDATHHAAEALKIEVDALGQPILHGVLARAQLEADAADCGRNAPPEPPTNPPTPTPSTPQSDTGNPVANIGINNQYAAFALQCTGAKVRLLDVRRSQGKTYLRGVAAEEYIGKQVNLYLRSTKQKVATVTVEADGLFSTRVPLPPKGYRNKNAARYFARVDGASSKRLKFARFVNATKVSSPSAGMVSFAGHVESKSHRKVLVTIKERKTCTSYRTVAKVRTDRNGNFKASFAAVGDKKLVVYRAQTTIKKTPKAKRTFPTYSLPRIVKVK